MVKFMKLAVSLSVLTCGAIAFAAGNSNASGKADKNKEEGKSHAEKEKTRLWKNKIEKITNRAYDAAKKRDSENASNTYNFRLGFNTTTNISFSDSLLRIKTGVVESKRGIGVSGRSAKFVAEGSKSYSNVTTGSSFSVYSERRLPQSIRVLDDCLEKAKLAIASNQILVLSGVGFKHGALFESEAARVIYYWNSFTQHKFDGFDEEKRKIEEEKYLARLKATENLFVARSGFSINLDKSAVVCELANP